MESMKAVRIHAYGNREMLLYEDTPCPEIGSHDILVRVAATSVNPFDWAVRNGYVAEYYPYTFPITLGLDISGIVELCGSEVQQFQPDDEIYGRANPAQNGAYAEYISVPASHVALKPKSLDFIQAAAVPHTAVSAWRALVDIGKLTSGQRVLILGAAGGVGTIAIQLAKNIGAYAIGTCSDDNIPHLRSLGADEVIDYNASRFEDLVSDIDLVVDLVGDLDDDTQKRAWQVLKSGGLLASLVQFPSPETAASYGVRSAMVTAEECDTETLTEISKLIDAGKIRPVVSSVYPLHEIKSAHAESESRHLRGKIVLQVAEL